MQRKLPTLIPQEKWEQIALILFYLALTGLGLIWLQLGNTWYAKVVPFYDSLSYQDIVEDILRKYQANGWENIVPTLFKGVSGLLYKLVIAILAPVLPLVRTTLYAYLIPVHLIALTTLFNFLHRKTNSLALGFLGPLLYISTTPFRRFMGGILDQRLDLATASFILLLWIVALDWAENFSSLKKSLTFGLVAGLALLHRPIIGVQASLAVVMLIGYAIWTTRRAGDLTFSTFLRRITPVVMLVIILLVPWLVFNAKAFYYYYVVDSYDVGGLSLSESISAYASYFVYFVGKPIIVVVGILLILAFVLQTISWKYFSLVAGLVLLPLVPLIISGASNAPVSQISLAGISLIPLIFIQKNRFSPTVPLIFTFLALGIAFWNVTILVKAVRAVDVKERLLAEEVLHRLNDNYSIKQPTYLSGFTLAGGSSFALTSIARLDLGIPLYTGLNPFHPNEFGLLPREAPFSEEEMDHAAACTLDRVFRLGGILMLIEPSLVEKLQPNLTWPLAHQMATHIDKLALESGRLVDSGITATLSGIPVHFYKILPGELPATLKCNS